MEFLKPLFLFFSGIFAGLYGASVGSGGLITLPALLLIGLPIHIAIASNRLAAVGGEFIAALRFHKAKESNLKISIYLGILSALGSFIGSNLVLKLEDSFVKLLTAIFLGMLLLFLIFKGVSFSKWVEVTDSPAMKNSLNVDGKSLTRSTQLWEV